MEYTFDINNRAFNAIKNNLKRIEIRATKKEATEEIKKYVHWYNHERIQKKLGYLSPVQYRLKNST